MRFLLIIIVIGFLLTSCNNCPPNMYLGRVQLSEETRSEIIYRDAQLAIFRNENGDLLPLEVRGFGSIALAENVIIGEICKSGSDDSYVKGDLEYVFGELIWPDSAFDIDRVVDLGIIFGMVILNYTPDTSFAEVANVYSVLRNQNSPDQGPPYGYLKKVTSNRGHMDESIDSLNEYYFLPDTAMLGRQFENLYRPIDNGLVYYTPGEGIVAFRDGLDVLWVLERIE